MFHVTNNVDWSIHDEYDCFGNEHDLEKAHDPPHHRARKYALQQRLVADPMYGGLLRLYDVTAERIDELIGQNKSGTEEYEAKFRIGVELLQQLAPIRDRYVQEVQSMSYDVVTDRLFPPPKPLLPVATGPTPVSMRKAYFKQIRAERRAIKHGAPMPPPIPPPSPLSYDEWLRAQQRAATDDAILRDRIAARAARISERRAARERRRRYTAVDVDDTVLYFEFFGSQGRYGVNDSVPSAPDVTSSASTYDSEGLVVERVQRGFRGEHGSGYHFVIHSFWEGA